MIPWWVWVLLWLLLVVAAALFVVLCGIRLYRGLMRLMDEASAAMDGLHLPDPPVADGVRDLAGDGSGAGGTGSGRGDGAAVGAAALFRDPELARQVYDDGKTARREARRVRRVERKRRNGQPQRMRDLHIGAVDL